MTTATLRSFRYRTTTEWLGRKEVRFASSPHKQPFVVTSPPEFRGKDGEWTPEELFVGAIETCLMLTFASLIEKHHLPVESYSSEAIGLLESAEDVYRFTRVTIKPTIVINDQTAAPKVLELISAALGDCLIANSIITSVFVEPEVVMSACE
jgi:organic hydroperoxide reductase OsmC/OhrA